MNSKKVRHAFVLICCLLIPMPSLCAFGMTKTIRGEAYDLKGNLEYIERHRVTYENGKLSESRTIYVDANNEVIGELVSEYSQGIQFGGYSFKDLRAAYEDGVSVMPGSIRLFRKERPGDEKESKVLPRSSDQIVGQGFHHFISSHLEAIARGKTFDVQLVMPSRLGQYRFRIQKTKIDGDRIWIRLEIENWLLRVFAPHVDVQYSMRTGDLLRYDGISMLADPMGKHKPVSIIYAH